MDSVQTASRRICWYQIADPALSYALELARGAKGLIRMVGQQTIIEPPEETGQNKSGRATERKPMNFTFDKSYWSAGERTDSDYCSQQTLFEDLGKELLEHAFNGFNACILACEWALSDRQVHLNTNVAYL